MTMRNYKLQVIHRWFTPSNSANKGNASLVLEGMASPKALEVGASSSPPLSKSVAVDRALTDLVWRDPELTSQLPGGPPFGDSVCARFRLGGRVAIAGDETANGSCPLGDRGAVSQRLLCGTGRVRLGPTKHHMTHAHAHRLCARSLLIFLSERTQRLVSISSWKGTRGGEQ